MPNFILFHEPDAAIHHHYMRHVADAIRIGSRQTRHQCLLPHTGLAWTTTAGTPATRRHTATEVALLLGDASPIDGSCASPANLLDQWRSKNQARYAYTLDGYHAVMAGSDDGHLCISGDCLGFYPIYYWTDGARAIVSSRPDLIAAHPRFPREIDRYGLAGILLVNALVANQTVWTGIQRLPCDRCLHWRPGHAPDLHRLHPEPQTDEMPDNNADRIAMLHRMSARCVEQALGASTGSLGCMLSGGLDSRSVLGYAMQAGSTPDFTMTFGKPDDLEFLCAAAVARSARVPHDLGRAERSHGLRHDLRKAVTVHSLAGGPANLWLWQAADALARRCDRCLSGLGWDVVLSTPLTATESAHMDYMRYYALWGVSTTAMERLFGVSKGRFIAAEVHRRLEEESMDITAGRGNPALTLLQYYRGRYHLGEAIWTLAQSVWPVTPIFNRRLLRFMDAMPHDMLAERYLQKAILTTYFPDFARAPVAKNMCQPQWLVAPDRRLPLAPNAPGTTPPTFAQEALFYWRVYGFRTHPLWRKLLKQSSRRSHDLAPGLLHPEGVAFVLEQEAFRDLFPERIASNTPSKNLLALREWLIRQRRCVLPDPDQAGDCPPGQPMPASRMDDAVIVRFPEAAYHDGAWHLRFFLHSNQWRQWVTYRFTGARDDAPATCDAAVPPALLIAMAGPFTRVHFEASISTALRQNAQKAHDLMRRRFAGVTPALLHAPQGTAPTVRRAHRGHAAFFTGGVDSCYTAWTERERLDSLIYVHGFDIPLENQDLFADVTAHLRKLADELGLPLVVVETNVRDATDRYALWGKNAFGGCLASVAHALAGRFQSVSIPASYDAETLSPAGSQPDLDPLWSSEAVEIRHHGEAASRLDKVRALGAWPMALRHLRVCWKNPGNTYNCCACEKCIRTMVVLDMAGLLDQAESFPTKYTLDDLHHLTVESGIMLSHWLQIARQLRELPMDPALGKAVAAFLERHAHLLS